MLQCIDWGKAQLLPLAELGTSARSVVPGYLCIRSITCALPYRNSMPAPAGSTMVTPSCTHPYRSIFTEELSMAAQQVRGDASSTFRYAPDFCHGSKPEREVSRL